MATAVFRLVLKDYSGWCDAKSEKEATHNVIIREPGYRV